MTEPLRDVLDDVEFYLDYCAHAGPVTGRALELLARVRASRSQADPVSAGNARERLERIAQQLTFGERPIPPSIQRDIRSYVRLFLEDLSRCFGDRIHREPSADHAAVGKNGAH